MNIYTLCPRLTRRIIGLEAMMADHRKQIKRMEKILAKIQEKRARSNGPTDRQLAAS